MNWENQCGLRVSVAAAPHPPSRSCGTGGWGEGANDEVTSWAPRRRCQRITGAPISRIGRYNDALQWPATQCSPSVPGSVTVAQEILVLFVLVRIQAG